MFDQSDDPNLLPDLFTYTFFSFIFRSPVGAEFLHWTKRTPGLGGNTDQSPEFHQGLIEIRGPTPRDKIFNEIFQKFFQLIPREISSKAMQTREKTSDIAIQRRLRPVKGQAGHCSCCVAAEPGKGKQALFHGRNFPFKISLDDFGRFEEMPGPGIVTQTSPGFEHFGQGGLSQRGQGWKKFQEAVIIGQDRFDPGLLQHELRNHDPIRIRLLPPRQVSPVTGIPSEKRGLKPSLLREGIRG